MCFEGPGACKSPYGPCASCFGSATVRYAYLPDFFFVPGPCSPRDRCSEQFSGTRGRRERAVANGGRLLLPRIFFWLATFGDTY